MKSFCYSIVRIATYLTVYINDDENNSKIVSDRDNEQYQGFERFND